VFTGTIDFSNGVNATTIQSQVWFEIDELKACQAASIETADFIKEFIASKLHLKVLVNLNKYYRGETGLTMYFTDCNAVWWMYPEGGRLLKQDPPNYVSTILNPVFKPVPACS
jgi:hypothetical protein